MTYQLVTNAPGTSALFNHRLDNEPGLGGFSLEFLNSDHHVGSLRVGGVTSDREGRVAGWRDFLLGFNDHDAGISGSESDPVRMTAKYFRMGPLPTFTVSGTGTASGSGLARIPRLRSDEIVVLRGFEIAARGDNHHIRSVGVRYLRWRDAFSVNFNDDSPADDSFSFSIHYFVLIHASRTGRRRNPHFEGPVQQTFRFTESTTMLKRLPGVALLSGFSFRFRDSDHHLRKIAVDLEPVDSLSVTFTDDDRNHPVDCFVEYVLARPYIF